MKAVLRVALLASLGCGARSGAPPPQAPTAAEEPTDAGLPAPNKSKKRGMIVPSDVGLGAGPSGPTSNSGTIPAVPPASGPPGASN